MEVDNNLHKETHKKHSQPNEAEIVQALFVGFSLLIVVLIFGVVFFVNPECKTENTAYACVPPTPTPFDITDLLEDKIDDLFYEAFDEGGLIDFAVDESWDLLIDALDIDPEPTSYLPGYLTTTEEFYWDLFEDQTLDALKDEIKDDFGTVTLPSEPSSSSDGFSVDVDIFDVQVYPPDEPIDYLIDLATGNSWDTNKWVDVSATWREDDTFYFTIGAGARRNSDSGRHDEEVYGYFFISFSF